MNSAARERRASAVARRVALAAICVVGLGTAMAHGQSNANSAGDGASACVRADQALASKQWQTAHDLYERCVQAGPARFETLSNLGTADTHLGLMSDAIGAYKKALALAPGNPRLESNLAVAYIEAGNCEAAVGPLMRLEEKSADTRTEELLAFCYYHLGHYSLAARAGERVEAVHPNDAANALILGSAYMRLAEYKKALPLITIALQRAGSAEGHLIMGETLLGLRQYHSAMKELEQAASLQPELPGLDTALGIGNVGLDNTQAAEAEFTAALGQDPNDFQANYYMGRLKRLDGNTAAAKKYLAVADRLHPGDGAVLFEIAAVAVSEQKCQKAIPMLNTVVAQEPNQRQAHFLLARCYQRTGKLEEAKAEREIFLKLRSAQQGKTRLPDLNGENRETASSAPGQR